MMTEPDAQPFSKAVLDLSQRFGEILRQQGRTCATAESCTGGGIAHAITCIAGASDYLQGGLVAYSNAIKHQHLGVSAATLASVGAVSEECAREMARGIRERLGVDIGISSTGIAGPTGATARKPVGLVYVAASSTTDEMVLELRLHGDRITIMQAAIYHALTLAMTLLGASAPDSEQ